MTRQLHTLLLASLLLAGLTPLFAQGSAASPEGTWLGTLAVGETSLRIAVNVVKTPDGTLTATADSPDQGATGIPIDKITFSKGTLEFSIAAIGASYSGQVSKDGKTLTGQLTQNGQTLPLTMKRTKAVKTSRPQDPKKPYPYTEEEVTYRNANAEITLAGTLTLPQGDGPFPTVLLITGSGAQDRNSTLMGHHPFWVLADALTRRGIAVLRVDDRGVGGSTGSMKTATTEDFAGDVQAGVAYLKSRKEVNARQIGLIGHSEGGIIAPMVAARSKDVAFIVLLAGTALPGEEILLQQGELVLRAMGMSQEAVDQEHAVQQRIFAIMKTEKDDAVAEQRLREFFKGELAKVLEAQRKSAGNTDAWINGQIAAVLSPWMRFFLIYDPRPMLQKVTVPVLALNGEKDTQVAPKENLQAIEQAVKTNGNQDVTVKTLPDLNHLFQTCTTGAPSEYIQIDETISPTALQLIGDWIAAHTKP